MSFENATARPWAYRESSGMIEAVGMVKMDICRSAADEHRDCPVNNEWPANRALIVRAVNSFDVAREALKNAVTLLNYSDVRHLIGGKLGESAFLHQTMADAREALALMEGGGL